MGHNLMGEGQDKGKQGHVEVRHCKGPGHGEVCHSLQGEDQDKVAWHEKGESLGHRVGHSQLAGA